MGSQSSFTPRLVVIEGKDKGKVIPLKDGTVVLGRSKGDILIHDPRISRSHIALKFDEVSGSLEFTDLKSLNGTILNGENKESGALKDGDKLQLGNTVFDCQITRDGDDATIKASVERKKKSSKKTTEPLPEESALSDLIPIESSVKEPAALAEMREDTGQMNIKEGKKVSLLSKFKNLPKRIRTVAVAGACAILMIVVFTRKETPSGNLGQEIREIRKIAMSGGMQEATVRAESLVNLNGSNPEALLLLGDLYLGSKQNERAIMMYRKVHELTPPVPIAHLRLIRALMKSGLAEEAAQETRHVDDVLKKEGPHSRELFMEAAQVYIEFKELKQPPEKVFILAKALQTSLAPDNSIGFKLEAQTLFQQGRNEEAVQSLERALQIDPKDEWVYENLAFAKLSAKDIAGATKTVDQWISAANNSTKPMLVMAYLKFNDGKLEDAQPILTRVIEHLGKTPTDPHYAEALNLLGQIYVQQNQPDIATSYLKQACSLGFEQSCAIAATVGSKGPGPASVEPPKPSDGAVNPGPGAKAEPAREPIQGTATQPAAAGAGTAVGTGTTTPPPVSLDTKGP